MSRISTHVLDIAAGRPAAGIPIRLYVQDKLVGGGITDQDGRCPALNSDQIQPGVYRIVFDVATDFYPAIEIQFRVGDATRHYHIPLLLSPFGYTTYRGT